MSFPTLTTGRFILRQIKQADQAKIFEGLSHPEVIPFYGISFKTLEEAQTQMEWYRELEESGTGIWWAICEQDKPDVLIGACGFNKLKKEHLCIETGFWLLPTFWKKGIMNECLPIIFQYAFQNMQIHRIEAIVEKGNRASGRLLEKCGFEYEGTLRECEIKNGKFISLEYYSMLNK